MNRLSRDIRAWIAVICCAVGTFWTGTMIFGFPGVLGEYWREVFEVSTAATSRVTMFILLALGCFSFFSGKFHMRFGTRKSFATGALLIILSLFVLIFAKNIYMVYVWAALNGAASIFIYSPALATVQRWMPQKKGLVTGIVNLTFGISAAIMSPIYKWMLVHLEYTTMMVVLIIIIAAANVIINFNCEVPELTKMTDQQKREHNLLTERMQKVNAKKGIASSCSYKPREAVKTIPFWCMCGIWACMGAAGISMVTLSTNYAAFLGIANGVAILTVFNVTNGISRIIAGVLFDKIGGRTTAFIAFIVATVGYVGLNFSNSFLWILIFAACVGYGFGTMFAVSAPLLTDIFGIEYFGLIFGLVFMAYGLLGGFIGPNLYGVVLQNTGSYHPVFIYLGCFALVSAILIRFVKPIQQKK